MRGVCDKQLHLEVCVYVAVRGATTSTPAAAAAAAAAAVGLDCSKVAG